MIKCDALQIGYANLSANTFSFCVKSLEFKEDNQECIYARGRGAGHVYIIYFISFLIVK